MTLQDPAQPIGALKPMREGLWVGLLRPKLLSKASLGTPVGIWVFLRKVSPNDWKTRVSHRDFPRVRPGFCWVSHVKGGIQVFGGCPMSKEDIQVFMGFPFRRFLPSFSGVSHVSGDIQFYVYI